MEDGVTEHLEKQAHQAWRLIRHGQGRGLWGTWFIGSKVIITKMHVSSAWRLWLWPAVLTLD